MSELPNVVYLFITLVLWIAPLLAILFIARHESLQARLDYARNRERSTLRLVLKSLAGALILFSLIAFLYVLPGTARDAFSFSRGQMFFSLLVSSRLGLVLSGPLIAMAAFCLWWAVFLAISVVAKALSSSISRRKT